MHKDQKLQKVLAVLILILIPAFIIKEYKHLTLVKKGEVFSEGYKFSYDFTKDEKKSLVVTLYHQKMSAIYKNNFEKILAQEYDKFRIIYFYEKQNERELLEVKELINFYNKTNEVLFVCSKKKNFLKELPQYCDKSDVIVDLDLSDLLVDAKVFEKINCEYQDPDVWLTYTDFINQKTNQKQGLDPYINRPLKELNIKKEAWMKSHMRTFYAGLINEVSDQIISNNLNDDQIVFSVLKIGKWHVKYFSEPLTIHYLDFN